MDERTYFIEQHRQMHKIWKRFKGHSLVEHIPQIDQLMEEHGCRTILDYGCGKAQYWPATWNVTGYDPAYEPYSQKPIDKYDMVICVDVMEHIPESATAQTLEEIFQYSKKWVFLVISTHTSDKRMPDGNSCHVNVKSQQWWQEQLSQYPAHTVIFI